MTHRSARSLGEGTERSSALGRRRRSESGDTLVEVLLAIVILGIASLAVILAFATSISGSAEHRSLATFDTVLRSASEEVVSQLQQQTASEFGTCTNPAPSYNVTFSLPTGYQATITQVQYWNGNSFGSTCETNTPQLFTIKVTNTTTNISYSISVVIDGPQTRPVSCATTATQLAFLQVPITGSSTVGTSFSNQPQVAIEGANNQYVCNDLSYLTLTINSSNGATLSGCSGTELGGVVSFSGCSTIQAGTYTLTATDGSLTQTSSPFTVAAGLPAQLVFNPSIPGPGTVGTGIPNVSVQIEDNYGNVVTTATGTIAMAIAAGSPQSTFTSGSASASVSGGTATFSNLVVDKAGTYTFTASDGSLTQSSGAFVVAAGPGTTAQSSVNDSPASVTANGTASSTITVTLVDPYGNPVPGKNVSLSQGAGSSTISAASGVSNASGVVTFTVTDTTAQSVTYTATDTTDGVVVTDTAIVAFVPGSVDIGQSSVNPSPSSVPNNGTTTSTVTVTLDDANGNAVAGKTVTLGQSTGGVSTISLASGVSSSAGVVTFTVKDATAQSVTYTARDVTDGLTITDTATVIFYGPVSRTTSSVNQSPSSVVADGATTSTITVTLLDANSDPVPGKAVALAQGTGSSTISAASGVSNASGVVTFTVTDTTAQTVVYTATDTTDGLAITDVATVVFTPGPGNAAQSSVNSSPATVAANGFTTSTITVTLLDANGNAVPGKTVTLAKSLGSSTISGSPAVSNASGVATFTVRDATAQSVTYTATDATDGVAITATATVIFYGPANATQSSVNPSPASVSANGVATSTITVTLLDVNGNPVPGKSVSLAQSTGGVSTVSGSPGVSNASGVATFTVKDATAQSVTYTATDTTDGVAITDTAAVIFYGPANRSQSLVNPAPASVPADGATTATVTVMLLDVNGNPVPGKSVSLAQSTGGVSTISAPSGLSSASGVVTFTVKDATPQALTYTATDTTDGVAVTDTAIVIFYGPVNQAQSSVNPNPAYVPADGATTSTVTVTLLDVNGNPVPGKTVTLAQSTGGVSTISAASGASNASGVVTFTVKDATAQSVTYTGTDTTDGIVLTNTAVVGFYGAVSKTVSTVSSNPTVVAQNGTSTITVTLRDANGTPVPGKTVTLTSNSSHSTPSPTSGVTNASGVVTFSVTDSRAETVTYSAKDTTDSNLAITPTASVQF